MGKTRPKWMVSPFLLALLRTSSYSQTESTSQHPMSQSFFHSAANAALAAGIVIASRTVMDLATIDMSCA